MASQLRSIKRWIKRNPEPRKLALLKLAELKGHPVNREKNAHMDG
jgi:hypothetical protein